MPSVQKTRVSLELPILAPSGAHHRADRPPLAPPPAPEHAHQCGRLLDSHGRTIRHLRISITDRCNFRCVYCMDPDVRFMPRAELLSVDEIARLARLAAAFGITRIRITGGEPTVHPDLTSIIAAVAQTGVHVAMTTNG